MQENIGTGNEQNQISDGLNYVRAQGILSELLNPGSTFEDFMIRGGLPMSDALDFAHIYRMGIAFRIPEMVMYAVHAFVASAGDNRAARTEGITAIIGRQSIQQPNTNGKARRFFKKGDPAKQADFDEAG